MAEVFGSQFINQDKLVAVYIYEYCVNICTCVMYVCVSMYVCMYVCACVYVCMCVCMHVCMYVCAYVSMHVCIYIQLFHKKLLKVYHCIPRVNATVGYKA